MRAVLRLLLLVVPLVVACGGGAANSPTPTSLASGLFSPGAVPTMEQLCALLTPDDWTAAGLADAGPPQMDDDGPGTGSAYCIYNGMSGEAGGLELDVFVSTTVDDAMTTFAEFAQSLPPSNAPNMSGIDDGLINANIEPGFAAILVRAGKVVLTITLPTSGAAESQLISLASLAMGRARSLQ